MLLNCGIEEDSWESLRLQEDPTLATWCEELTHLKIPQCWERLWAGGEGDDRGWNGWMASLTQWTWFWVDSGSWWWTGMSGMLQFMMSQRVRHDWGTELNWTTLLCFPDGSAGKESACNVGDLGWIPGSGRSPQEGNGNPLQYSCLDNSMATVHRIINSWTWLSD